MLGSLYNVNETVSSNSTKTIIVVLNISFTSILYRFMTLKIHSKNRLVGKRFHDDYSGRKLYQF